MSWELSPALETLRSQLNSLYPARSKASDGTIGDAAHATRQSDHNPDKNGIVSAMDVTNDPKHGVDCNGLAEFIIKDNRVTYIIFNRRIRYQGKSWQPYTGANPHDKHMHISVSPNNYNDARKWNLSAVPKGGTNVQLTEADVITLYKRVLKRTGDVRKADPNGVKNYTGKTLDFALADMLASEEFRSQNTKTVTVTKEVGKADPVLAAKAAKYDQIVKALK